MRKLHVEQFKCQFLGNRQQRYDDPVIDPEGLLFLRAVTRIRGLQRVQHTGEKENQIEDAARTARHC